MEHLDTLLDAVNYFSDKRRAHDFIVNLRWPDGVVCPHCSDLDVTFMEARLLWQCKAKECRRQFSVKIGTVFTESPIGLDKWLPCLWLICNAKYGISSYEVGRALGVTQKSAWFMLHRVRLAMQTESFGKFGGEVEADETFIGGRARFMHKDKKNRVLKTHGHRGKVAVMGLLERNSTRGRSRVKVQMIDDTKRQTVQDVVRANVKAGATLYTDELKSYDTLDAALGGEFQREFVNHAERYVDGQIHTNGMENFWCLLKRAIKGTYVAVEPFRLFRYLDEQAFRFNNRKWNDAQRFIEAAKSIVGKRLTFRSLTGADLEETYA